MNQFAIFFLIFTLVFNVYADTKEADLKKLQEIVQKTDESLNYLITEVKKNSEEKVMAQFNTESTASVWDQGNMYFSTYDCNTYTVLGHPFKSFIKGKKMLDLKDKKGKLFFKELCDIAKKFPQGGWVDYWFPKPGKDENIPFQKIAYIKGKEYKLDNGTVRFYALTAGIYSDTLTIKEVQDKIKLKK